MGGVAEFGGVGSKDIIFDKVPGPFGGACHLLSSLALLAALGHR